MPEFLDTAAAADYLHEQVPGESLNYWTLRLTNLRRTDRPHPFLLGFAKYEGKAGYYLLTDVAAYAEFEKTRRIGKVKLSSRAAQAMRAFGIGELGGGSQGRLFKGGSAALAVGNADGKPFVQAIINEPLMVFALTAEQAITFGRDLVETGQAAKRIEGDMPNSDRTPKTIVARGPSIEPGRVITRTMVIK
jgi:hypothetical protein